MNSCFAIPIRQASSDCIVAVEERIAPIYRIDVFARYAVGFGAAGTADAGGGRAVGSIDAADGNDGAGLPGHGEHGEGLRR